MNSKISLFKNWLYAKNIVSYGEIEQWCGENYIKEETVSRKLRIMRNEGDVVCLDRNKEPIINNRNITISYYKVAPKNLTLNI